MKKPTQIAGLLLALMAALISKSVVADTDNCSAYYPKVPYSCVLVRIKNVPLERADFSAFEVGIKGSKTSGSKNQYTLRSVSLETARKLRTQTTDVIN